MTESEAVTPAITVSVVNLQSDLMSAEDAQLLLPKLTDEHLATLKSYGTREKTSVGQVLATAGDLTYDLMVVLKGEVEISDIHDGRRRALSTFGPRDFIAELNLLTGQRVYVTVVVTEAGSIIRVPPGFGISRRPRGRNARRQRTGRGAGRESRGPSPDRS
jgi:hypothetical protein